MQREQCTIYYYKYVVGLHSSIVYGTMKSLCNRIIRVSNQICSIIKYMCVMTCWENKKYYYFICCTVVCTKSGEIHNCMGGMEIGMFSMS